MGALLSFGRIRKVKVASRVAQVLHDKDEENDNRRNSLAYNLEEYVKLKGGDPTRLLLERKTELGKCPITLRLAMMYFTGI